jgi:hypothetical protein
VSLLWLHHLRQGDYARWFRKAIKDEALAAEAKNIQRHHADDPPRAGPGCGSDRTPLHVTGLTPS